MRAVLLVFLLVACGDNRASPDAGGGTGGDDVDAATDGAGPACGNGVVEGDEQCDDGLRGLSGDGCSSTCRTESLVITMPTRETMVHRNGHALAYDVSRARTVMFGGNAWPTGTAVLSDETWEYDGASWQRVATAVSPPPRTRAAMFYEHGRVVLFGGVGATGDLSDTWTFDGTLWSQQTTTVVPTGQVAGAAFDRQRDRGVLVTASGTYEWVESDWTRVADAPPTSTYAALAYAGGGRVAAMSDESTSFWNGTTWTAIATSPHRDGTLAYDSTADRLVSLSVDYQTTWGVTLARWGGSDWVDLPAETAPFARITPIVFDEQRGALHLFDGKSAATASADTWSWNGTLWSHVHDSAVPPRLHAAQVFDTSRGEVRLFGGVDGSLLADTWQYDGAWHELSGPGPEARIPLVETFDEEREAFVLIGGQVNYVREAPHKVLDVWELVGGAWTRRMLPINLADDASFMIVGAYDRAHHYTLIVIPDVNGGHTYTWDGATLIERTPPPTGAAFQMAYDARRGVMVLAELREDQVAPAYYEWTGASWALRGTQPDTGSLFYDPVRGQLIVAGAEQFWAYDGRSLVPLGGTPRHLQWSDPPVYDRRHRAWFQFGPHSGWDTWLARWQSGEPDEACDGTTDADLDGLTGCDDPDCYWRCTPRCPPRTTCDPSWPHCGDAVCSPLEDAALCPTDCP